MAESNRVILYHGSDAVHPELTPQVCEWNSYGVWATRQHRAAWYYGLLKANNRRTLGWRPGPRINTLGKTIRFLDAMEDAIRDKPGQLGPRMVTVAKIEIKAATHAKIRHSIFASYDVMPRFRIEGYASLEAPTTVIIFDPRKADLSIAGWEVYELPDSAGEWPAYSFRERYRRPGSPDWRN